MTEALTDIKWEELLLAEIDATSDELLQLASELIQIPSENPSGDCTEVANFVAKWLTDRGIECQIMDAGNGRLNVISHRDGTDTTARHLVLAGHHDVVPVGDESRWDFPPFAGDIVDGYLRGRGASDMKAGLAGVIHVFVLMHRLSVPLKGRLSLASVADEEAGGPHGADWVLDSGALDGATGAIIAEPSERSHPTIGQKGSNWFRLTIEGQPGHGSLQPIHGTNANLLAAKAIIALQALWDMVPDAPQEVRELILSSQIHAENREGYQERVGQAFDHVTINIGTIHGGSATNVVADRAVVEIDTRVPIGLTRSQVLERVQEILDDEGIPALIEPLGFCSEPNWTLPDDPIVQELVGVLQDITDPQAAGVLQWASSDARTFRSHGIPVLQYGPAELSTIHGFNERAKVIDIINAAKVYALTTTRYLDLDEASDD